MALKPSHLVEDIIEGAIEIEISEVQIKSDVFQQILDTQFGRKLSLSIWV